MKRIATAAAIMLVATSLLLAGTAGARVHATTDGVKASEFKFVLTKKIVAKGVVTFTVKNVGALAHDFKIAGKKTPLIAPGGSKTLRVTFTKAGKYPYLCTVPGHASAGMKGVLTVK